jgi:O-acetyl-ADP-ribose deacetylase (regulator of RNase III)
MRHSETTALIGRDEVAEFARATMLRGLYARSLARSIAREGALMAKRSESLRVGYIRLTFASDITGVTVDRRSALVSSDDTLLTAGGGVSAAILARAGDSVRAEMDAHVQAASGRLRLGHTVATSGGSTGAEHILHATTLDFDVENGNRLPLPDDLVGTLYGRILDHAELVGARHVIVPLLGMGAAELDIEEVLAAFTFALIEHAAIPSRLSHVTLALGDRPPSIIETRHLDRWLACTPRLPPLKDLATSCLPSMRGALRQAARQLDVAARVPALLAAVTRGIASLDPTAVAQDMDDSLVDDAIARVRASDLGEGLVVDLETVRQVASLVRLDSADAVALASDLRALHRLAASDLLADPEAAARRRTLDVSVPVTICPRWYALVDAARFAAAFPDVAEAVRTDQEPSLADTSVRGSDATTSVTRLGMLLRKELAPDELAELMADARKLGRRGDDWAILTEHLLELAPDEALDFLPILKLRRLARESRKVGEEEIRVKARCVDVVLGSLDFTVTRPVLGLTQYREQVEARKGDAEREPLRAAAAVMDAAKAMERVVKTLLTFHCRHHFDSDVDALAHARRWLTRSESIQRCSLGKLLDLVVRVDNALECDDTEPGRRYKLLFQQRRLPAPRSLAEHRNVCIHDRKGQRVASEEEVAQATRAFFEMALAWLDHLGAGEHPLFPRIIQIRGEQVDRWGRRTFDALDDRGATERIYSYGRMEVGANYFMHPRSNPVRVFPVLVKAD